MVPGSGSARKRDKGAMGNMVTLTDIAAEVDPDSADPWLADVARGNTHIQPNSPCKDAGDDAVVQAGWLDIDSQTRIIGPQ